MEISHLKHCKNGAVFYSEEAELSEQHITHIVLLPPLSETSFPSIAPLISVQLLLIYTHVSRQVAGSALPGRVIGSGWFRTGMGGMQSLQLVQSSLN